MSAIRSPSSTSVTARIVDSSPFTVVVVATIAVNAVVLPILRKALDELELALDASPQGRDGER